MEKSKNFLEIKNVKMGYVLEAQEHEEAGEKSYDDMKKVGYVRLAASPRVTNGDDLNDTPFNSNGSIFDGESVELEKGDMIIVIKK